MNKLNAIRLSYFLLFASFGFYYPYIGLCLKRYSWSGVEIGLTLCLASLLGFFGQFIFSRLSDKTRNKREIFTILALTSSVIACCIGWTKGILLCVLIAVLGLTHYPLVPLLDSVSFDLLSGKARGKYGHLRVFGTLGYLFASAIVALFLLPIIGLHSVFYAFSLAMVISVILPQWFPPSPVRVADQVTGSWIADKRIRWVAVMMFFFELASTCIHGYLGIYMDKYYLLSDSVIPLAWTIGLISEILLFQASPYLLRHFTARTVLLIGGGAAATRYLFLSSAFAISSPFWFFASQILHGFYYSIFFCAALAFLDICSPTHERATIQSSASAFSTLGGFIIGFPLSGWLWQMFGLQTLFFVSGCFALAGLSILFHPVLVDLSQPIVKNVGS
ncbi:MAG: MFS transporter [Nostoc sp. DedSLP03]|uniref:MFS transporter n=1 Tax=Nostoc sp. DedSLP03 TaxID=3075400 RepID=UPI002AD3313A|nr:MFS transporter [Nostoc sp. DedSLP03]MDZ7970278.1 MFS transporter [Nostoc sp. DedSLP03]